MPRDVSRRTRTNLPAGDTTVAEPPPVTPTRIPRPPGFERAPGAGPVALEAPLGAGVVPQGEVFHVTPQHPETVTAALAKLDALEGVEVETLGDIDGLPVQVATISGAPPPPGVAPKRVLLTGGVHGSEPAGCIAAVELLELVAAHPEAFAGYAFTVVPLVNPEGFRDDTRQNENDHQDLNRTVNPGDAVPKEIRLVLPVLDRGPWDLALDLHASGSTTTTGKNGFFAIRTTGSDELLHAVMSEFAQTHPVLDETTMRYDLVEPGVVQSHNDGTVKQYLYNHGTERSFTVEAPALAALGDQVHGLIDVVRGFLSHLEQ